MKPVLGIKRVSLFLFNHSLIALLLMIMTCYKLDVKDNMKPDLSNRSFRPLPLHRVVRRNDVGAVKEFLRNSTCDIAEQDVYGNTALHIASGLGYKAVVEVLVGVSGIDVNVQDKAGDTALHLAAGASGQGHKAVVEVLLGVSGIDVNTKDKASLTALCLAENLGFADVAEVLRGPRH